MSTGTSLASSALYRHYALSALTLTYTLSLLDQGLMTLILEPIKQDLHVSDSQLGFLTGIAFGLFYATVGLPIGRWADRSNRVAITAMAVALWGGMMILPLGVRNFGQLVLARMAAAIGGAGCMPPSYSLVGDYFPQSAERARAMAIYMLANPLSYLLGFGLGGWLNDHYGWRAAFFAIGIPGMLLGALIATTLKEPRRHLHAPRVTQAQHPRLSDVLTTLWSRRSMRHLVAALVLVYILGLGTLPWYGAFMMRSHGMQTTELGIWFAAIFGLGGIVGGLFGGYAAARWFGDDEKGQMRMVAVTIAALIPCLALFLLLRDRSQSLLVLMLLMVVWNMYLGPVFAIMQRLVSSEMRATTVAVVMLAGNLIGMGIGPQMVGILSDWFQPVVGVDSLRYAILCMSLLAAWAAYHFWCVGHTVKQDLAAV